MIVSLVISSIISDHIPQQIRYEGHLNSCRKEFPHKVEEWIIHRIELEPDVFYVHIRGKPFIKSVRKVINGTQHITLTTFKTSVLVVSICYLVC